MIASVINHRMIAILYLTAAIFAQRCLSQDAVQDNFLLVASRPYLYQIDLVSGAIVSLFATFRDGLVAVAYDPVEMVFYWTDVDKGLIGKNRLKSSQQESTIIFQNPTGALPLDGLALDVENRKLYYADAGNYPKIVEMNLDGSRPVAIVNETGMQPRALVLDTGKRDLYYTDWGIHPGIYAIDLITHQKTTILNNNLTWPNALAIDFEERVMYWADAATDRIEMANLDGSGRTILVNGFNAHYYAMALSPQYIYITDWLHNAVERLDRRIYTMSNQMPNLTGHAFGIVYYNSSFATGAKKLGSTTTTTITPSGNSPSGSTKLGDATTFTTTKERDRSDPPTSQIDRTTVLIAAIVAGGVIVITGLITVIVCCITKRKRTSTVEEPHYMTNVSCNNQSSNDNSSHDYECINQVSTVEEPHYMTNVSCNDQSPKDNSSHDYERINQYI